MAGKIIHRAVMQLIVPTSLKKVVNWCVSFIPLSPLVLIQDLSS